MGLYREDKQKQTGTKIYIKYYNYYYEIIIMNKNYYVDK